MKVDKNLLTGSTTYTADDGESLTLTYADQKHLNGIEMAQLINSFDAKHKVFSPQVITLCGSVSGAYLGQLDIVQGLLSEIGTFELHHTYSEGAEQLVHNMVVEKFPNAAIIVHPVGKYPFMVKKSIRTKSMIAVPTWSEARAAMLRVSDQLIAVSYHSGITTYGIRAYLDDAETQHIPTVLVWPHGRVDFL